MYFYYTLEVVLLKQQVICGGWSKYESLKDFLKARCPQIIEYSKKFKIYPLKKSLLYLQIESYYFVFLFFSLVNSRWIDLFTS